MIGIIKLRLLRLKDDIAVFALMTAMALGMTAVFGFSFNGYRPTVLIIDEDKSAYSEMFINELKSNNGFNFVESTMNSAVKEVEEDKASVALLIKNGFHNEVEAGDSVSLGIIKIKDDTLILTLQEMVSSIALKMAGGVRVAAITADYIASQSPNSDKNQVRQIAYDNVIASWKYKIPIDVTTTVFKTNTDSGYDGMKHSMIGFSLFFSMYTMVFSISTILYDKQHKTLQRMLISPVSKSSILGGSMIVAYLMGALQMVVLILGGKYLLGVDWGNSTAGVLMVTAAFIFTVTSFGLLLSGVVKSQAQLGSMAPLVLTSTSMLGGCMWPLEIVNNKILLFLAELTPQKWAIQGIENIAAKGMGFEAAILPTIVLLIMGILFFGAGVKIMKIE